MSWWKTLSNGNVWLKQVFLNWSESESIFMNYYWLQHLSFVLSRGLSVNFYEPAMKLNTIFKPGRHCQIKRPFLSSETTFGKASSKFDVEFRSGMPFWNWDVIFVFSKSHFRQFWIWWLYQIIGTLQHLSITANFLK